MESAKISPPPNDVNLKTGQIVYDTDCGGLYKVHTTNSTTVSDFHLISPARVNGVLVIGN
jgi:hypothetical protein